MGFSVHLDGKPVRLNGRIPLLPLRDVVLFPGTTLPLFVGRAPSVAAIEKASASRKLLFAVAQRRSEVSQPRLSDLHDVGSVVRLRQLLRLPDGTMRVLLDGLARGRLRRLHEQDQLLEAELEAGPPEGAPSEEAFRLLPEVQRLFLEYARICRRLPEDAVLAAASCPEPLLASYRIASHLLLKLEARQEILEASDPAQRLRLLEHFLAGELEVAKLEQRIEAEVRGAHRVDARDLGEARPRRARRKGERGEGDEAADELAELEANLRKARMPAAVEEKARREMERLSKMAFLSPEATVCRTYIDWLLALPWKRRTRDRTGIAEAEVILDEDHYGLAPVKERILEQIAVIHLSREVKGPVLCLVGPPGVGKTSLGRSVARALNRRFVRMSLGGVRDEAEIRGHRRTYIGAMPGRILQAMRRAGTVNPVLLLDEVDKLGLDYRGDPAAALLEVLDPEQNVAFNDHYLEVDYDLSRVLFLTTANTTSGIPPALRDRMEVIRLPGYLETEKLVIAERFLLPKQRAAAGLVPGDLDVRPESLQKIIREYTREAGVRNLEREVARLSRKAARRKASTPEVLPLSVAPEQVEAILGVPRFSENPLERRNRIGVATGLAWSEVGGTVLQVEVGVLPGRGKLILTGKLGATMRESAQAALSCVRSRAELLGLKRHFYRAVDIHVHIPEGEVPKDGPSAGATIALAMVSALTQSPTRESVALTGELTLRGQVLPVGGLAEKTVAAQRAGVKTILIPAANERNLSEIPEAARLGVRFIPVSCLEEVLRFGLVKRRVARLDPDRARNRRHVLRAPLEAPGSAENPAAA